MQIGRLRAVLLVERELRTALDQLVGELETAAGEHGEAVAGAELMLGDEHAPPAPPQLLNRDQASRSSSPKPSLARRRVRRSAAATTSRTCGGMSTVAPSPPNA